VAPCLVMGVPGIGVVDCGSVVGNGPVVVKARWVFGPDASSRPSRVVVAVVVVDVIVTGHERTSRSMAPVA
jgi:hypothetical protein